MTKLITGKGQVFTADKSAKCGTTGYDFPKCRHCSELSLQDPVGPFSHLTKVVDFSFVYYLETCVCLLDLSNKVCLVLNTNKFNTINHTSFPFRLIYYFMNKVLTTIYEIYCFRLGFPQHEF